MKACNMNKTRPTKSTTKTTKMYEQELTKCIISGNRGNRVETRRFDSGWDQVNA